MYTINSEQCLGKCHCKARLSSTHLWSPHWRNWGQRITMPRLHSKTLSCLKVTARHVQCGMWTGSHNRVWESSVSGPHAWRKQKQSLPFTLVKAKMQAFSCVNERASWVPWAPEGHLLLSFTSTMALVPLPLPGFWEVLVVQGRKLAHGGHLINAALSRPFIHDFKQSWFTLSEK